MRLVHFADTHLGLVQYAARTPAGINQRELDVERSFAAAIEQTIALAPELVVVPGDVFHFPSPHKRAITAALCGFKRLLDALPAAQVVIAAGNHDTPHVRAENSIFRAFSVLGPRMHAVYDGARYIDLPDLDASVLAVPDEWGFTRPALVPKGTRRFNVLCLHGETGGVVMHGALESEIPAAALHPDAWDYIALGHYHVYHQVGPRAYYSGSIDYTATNPWGELVEQADHGIPGKGIVERDLATGRQTFHPLPISRRFVELPAIDGRCATPALLDDMIAEAVASVGGIDDAVARLTLYDVEKGDIRALNHTLLRGYRTRALSFQLVPKAAEVIQIGSAVTFRAPAVERTLIAPRITGSDPAQRAAGLAFAASLLDMLDPYEHGEAAALASMTSGARAHVADTLALPAELRRSA